jgi:hypothetical protein
MLWQIFRARKKKAFTIALCFFPPLLSRRLVQHPWLLPPCCLHLLPLLLSCHYLTGAAAAGFTADDASSSAIVVFAVDKWK